MTEENGYEPGQIVTQAERDLAVTHWLLAAARDRAVARAEWDDTGVTLLPCAGLFAAVRFSADLIHSAVATSDPARTAEALAAALHHGPVIADASGDCYYALVPPSTMVRRQPPGIEYVRRASLLVPRPGLTDLAQHGHAPYWAVPMDGPGDLCQPDAVFQLATVARYRSFQEGALQ